MKFWLTLTWSENFTWDFYWLARFTNIIGCIASIKSFIFFINKNNVVSVIDIVNYSLYTFIIYQNSIPEKNNLYLIIIKLFSRFKPCPKHFGLWKPFNHTCDVSFFSNRALKNCLFQWYSWFILLIIKILYV